ncbi:MAG: prephenate dehydrogenase [Oscillospiraceae bacterium]|nr:prephenate dehydrogenase [Oscillospiraceae bacterium]
MNIAIIGLGIIGGSFAKALKKYTDHYIIGINRTKATLQQAFDCKAIDEMGDEKSLEKADLIILGLYPGAAVDYIEKNGKYIKKGTIVTDSSGIKAEICPKMVNLSKKFGFTFVGSHPMAGKEKNGFSVSEADLYKGASYIIVPCEADEKSVKLISDLALKIGFGGIKITTPEEHDRMIAFTSQLPHVLACAYVMSPCCLNHKGFSAGSYRDVSRVANINSELWSELFLENKEPLLAELDELIKNINSIKNAIKKENKEELSALLEKGHKVKEELGE